MITAETHTIRSLLSVLERVLHESVNGTEKLTALQALDARREAREIVAAFMNVRPVDVSRLSDEPATDLVVSLATSAAHRRTRGEPLAYCVGTAAFRNLVLHVDPRVLIPRPETEVVVEEALRVTSPRPGGLAVDIGTGSGAIALSLATEGRFDRVIATDASPEALTVARGNASRILPNSSLLEFREGFDLAPLDGVRARVIVSNPPYIAHSESSSLPSSVRDWEPAIALFADDNGMARYDVLLAGAPMHLETGGWLILEVDSRRATETARRAAMDGRYSSVQLIKDLAGRDRVLRARYTNEDFNDNSGITGQHHA